MRYGETWPAPRTGGGPAITPPAAPPAAQPTRSRHARVLAYAATILDARDAHRTAAPELGCPDCSAGPGEWCDPWCPRFQ